LALANPSSHPYVVYQPPDNPWHTLADLLRRLPPGSAFAGPTAAWLLGLPLDPLHPIDVIVPVTSGVRSRAGLNVRHCMLEPTSVVISKGLPSTSIVRTLRDLALRLPRIETLVAVDAALRAGLIDRSTITAPRRLRMVAVHAEPAESPMETRLRWLLIKSGLPKPEVQRELRNADGRFVGRADLYYPTARLVIEYDGGTHRDRLVEDDHRQNLLLSAGYRLLRFTATDMHQRPETITSLVHRMLRV
jgi:very-short-patch-repair endonuclease